MKDNYTIEEYLGSSYQLKFLWQLLTEPEFSNDIIPHLKVSYWDEPSFKRFFIILKEFYKDYGKSPNLQNKSIHQAIKKYNLSNDPTDIETLNAILLKITNWNDRVLNNELDYDGDIVRKEAFSFIKQGEYADLSNFINKKLKEGKVDDKTLIEIEEKIKRISEIGDNEDEGIEVTNNLEEVFEKDFREPIPIGIPEIDTLMGGGLGRGEMGILLAPSGVGKTTFLTLVANEAHSLGKNVLQIVFEDTPKQIRRKHVCIWSEVKQSEMTSDDGIELAKERTLAHINKNKDNFGKLIIKRFSQEDTTIPKIRKWIDKYYKKNGIKFDIIILDYLDCVEPHKKSFDQNSAELSIVKAFEAMAGDYNIPCWTALQTNRCLDLSTLVEIKGKGKIKIKDVSVDDMILTHKGYRRITKVFPIEKQKRYKVKLKSGKEIICSEKHLFPTSNDSLLSISNGLKVGDKLLTK